MILTFVGTPTFVENTFTGKELQELEKKLRERREFEDNIGLTAVRGKSKQRAIVVNI